MTKEKDHIIPGISETKILLPISLKKTAIRTVQIEEATETQSNTNQTAQLEHLFEAFTSKVEGIDLMPIPKIPERFKNDFLLSKFIHEFEKQYKFFLDLEKQARLRWVSCHQHPDYHQDLIKLLSAAVSKLSDLQSSLSTLCKDMMLRLELISFHVVEPQHLNQAQNKLIAALDSFILSLLVLEFNPTVYEEAAYLKKHSVVIVEEFEDLLKDERLQFDKNVVDELISQLLAHLGIKYFLGIQVKIQPQPSNSIHWLLLKLFELKESTNAEDMAQKVLAFYSLAARLDTSPIHKIKNHEILNYCKRDQERLIASITTELQIILNQLVTELQQVEVLFSSTEYENLKELKTGYALKLQMKQLTSDLNRYRSGQVKGIPPYDLIQFTGVQEETITKLANIKQQISVLASNTQSCVRSLAAIYAKERLYFISELQDAINQAHYVLEIQPNPDCLREIEQGNVVANELLNLNPDLPLHSIKTKVLNSSTQLKGFIHEVKSELKLKWSAHIFSILRQKCDSVSFSSDSQIETILRQIAVLNTPYKTTECSPNNPLYRALFDVNEECNHSLNQLISHYSRLEQSLGQDLKPWMIKIRNLFQRCHENLSKQNTLQMQAQNLEHRLQNKAYLSCLEIIKLINNKFINLLGQQAGRINAKEMNKELLGMLLEKPQQLLQKSQLEATEIKLLNQLDPQLFKLFTLSKELRLLNTHYINEHSDLSSENSYVNQLILTTADHLEKDCRDLYARGFDFADRYIDWLHINVYQPFLKHHTPSPDQRYNPAFFQGKAINEDLNLSMSPHQM